MANLAKLMLTTWLACAGAAAWGQPAPVWYVPTPVPDASWAMNNAGQVAGTAVATLPYSHAFLWTNGVKTDLGTLGGNMSRGFGVNDAGHVVGGAAVGPGDFTPWHAFLYRDGAMRDLGTLGGSTSEAAAVNAGGQVTGYANTVFERPHAFRYSNGVMQDLGTLDGATSRGTDINQHGDVVGVSGGHAFLYSDGLRDLGAPRGYSLARAINDHGQVVGLSGTSDIDGHAFLYQGGVMQDLGTLGGTFSAAFDINNLGQVVGWTDVAGVDGRLAFIHAGGVMQTIDSLIYGPTPFRFSMAYAINDQQQILAGGCDAYRCGTFRLDPVPEPSALFMIVPGLLLLALAARRPRRRPGGAGLRALAAALLVAAWPARAAEPYVQTLMPAGTAALNDFGVVTGTYLNPNGHYRAFRWTDGIFADIGTLGGTYSNGLAINNGGTIVGVSGTAGHASHAFVYRDGAMRDLGVLGGVASAAVAVNSRHQVAGNITLADGRQRAFIYDNGTMREIGTLNALDSTAYAINDLGHVVGRSGNSAFLYADGRMTNIGTLGGQHAVAYDINNAGQIVGASGTPATGRAGHAFLWEGGVFTDLGTTGFPGEVHDSAAIAINEGGDLVGYDIRNFDVHAFVDKGGVREELTFINPGAGIRATYPFAINAGGHILSHATIPGGDTVVVRYAPVSSIPEPAPVLLWFSALCVLAWQLRRRALREHKCVLFQLNSMLRGKSCEGPQHLICSRTWTATGTAACVASSLRSGQWAAPHLPRRLPAGRQQSATGSSNSRLTVTRLPASMPGDRSRST